MQVQAAFAVYHARPGWISDCNVEGASAAVDPGPDQAELACGEAQPRRASVAAQMHGLAAKCVCLCLTSSLNPDV